MDKIFLVQKEYVEDRYNIEEEALFKLIRLYAPRHLDKYELVEYDKLKEVVGEYREKGIDIKKRLIPVGNINFVGRTLQEIFQREDVSQKPIEIPDVLGKYTHRYYAKFKGKFLKRDLDTSKYFIKDIDTLKKWNNLLYLGRDVSEFIEDDTTYSVSEIIDIKSEYRVLVLNDEIIGCQYYLGDVLTFPNKHTLKTMVEDYKNDKTRPRAYTLDVGVIEEDGRDITVPLEIHVFTSCGLYGFFDEKLLNMLSYGFEYCVKENEENKGGKEK